MTEREITKLASDLYDEGLRAADREKIAEKTDLSSHGNLAVPFLTFYGFPSYTIRLHLLRKKSKVLFRMPC